MGPGFFHFCTLPFFHSHFWAPWVKNCCGSSTHHIQTRAHPVVEEELFPPCVSFIVWGNLSQKFPVDIPSCLYWPELGDSGHQTVTTKAKRQPGCLVEVPLHQQKDLEMCRAVLGLQSDWMPSAVLGTQDTGTRSVWYSGQSFGMKNHLTQMPTLALLRNPGVQRGLASESQGREWTLNLLGPWWQKRMEVWLRSQRSTAHFFLFLLSVLWILQNSVQVCKVKRSKKASLSRSFGDRLQSNQREYNNYQEFTWITCMGKELLFFLKIKYKWKQLVLLVVPGVG